ncbi:MAG: diguanylate cyclase, partial [Planctomycetota bacterium]
MVRLGIASSLFYALRAKHPATAAHGLRVALFCSAWADHLGLDPDVRDRIEVAALLHDVGKIGVPDEVLRKVGKLNSDEQIVMDACPEMGCEILSGCTADPDLLDMVRYNNTWFNSRRDGDTPQGDALPIGARMLAIADAFDAMTTQHIYREAKSGERAIAELNRGSGSQFDPQLIADFSRLLSDHPEILQGSMVHRWLQQLRPNDSESLWSGKTSTDYQRPAEVLRRETRFNKRLLCTLKDGVAFTDANGSIQEWNLAMTRLTGFSAEAMIGKTWSAWALRMRDSDGDPDSPAECLMQHCLRTRQSARRAMTIEQPGVDSIPVHVEVAPVIDETAPGAFGTVVVVHDLSDRKHLEERLQTLHEKTVLDALTQVANRAHFDDVLTELVDETTDGGPTFSLVICDIDHFKRINDTFGHPIGDEALKVFADVLRSHSRDGDLVARYGGEEFLLLATGCDNATAAKRAESLRSSLEKRTLNCLDGQAITASFGVTEFQSGDTAETIIARADRALLKAKDNGRNRVVQLGMGKMTEVNDDANKGGWLGWLLGSDATTDTAVDILTPVPMDLAIEKIRGFIADHRAEIVTVKENQLSLRVCSGSAPGGRRRVDHNIAFHVKLTLSAAQADERFSTTAGNHDCTKVHVELKP